MQRAIAGDWFTAALTFNSVTVRATASSVARPSPTVTRTAAAVPAGNGATAQCNDGTYSHAAHHQGACSHHGGVRQFYK